MAQTLDSLVVELKADIKGLQTSLRTAANNVKQFSDESSRSVGGFEQAISRARSAILTMAVAWQAFNVGRSIVQAGAQVEALSNKMLAATADSQVAAAAMAFVRSEADRLGLSVVATADGFAGFSASALRAGLTFQQTQDIFTGVSEAAVSMRLSVEQTQLVFKALEQIAGKGTVSMEELRGQLGDSLPGAFSIAAKAMGMTTAEFTKMVSEGKVLASDFLPKFGDAMRRELGGGAEEASRGAQAAFNRLGNSLFDLQAKLAQSGLLDSVVDAVRALTDALNNPTLVAGLSAMVAGLAKIIEYALRVASAVGNMASAINRAAEAVGNSIFGTLFGKTGTDALDKARGANGANTTRQPMRIPVAPGGYTLGTVSAPVNGDAEKAAKKAQSLREQLRAAADSLSYRFAEPEKQAFMDLEEQEKTLRKALEMKAITEQEFRELSLQSEMEYQEKLAEIRENARADEQTALEGFLGIQLRTQQEIQGAKISDQGKALRATLQQAAQHNKTFFQLEKAAALARALIAARESVVSAFAFGTRIGGPYVGAAFAAVAAAAQAVNIASLASASYGGGGTDVSSGGGGGGSSDVGSYGDYGSNASGGKTISVTLVGSEMAAWSKNQVRDFIELLNDAGRDGSKLTVQLA